MIRSILMGIVAGSRSMTPLAVVANAARRGELPADNGAPKFLGHPLVSLATIALAVYELVGDKQKSAPNRIIPPAIVVRAGNAAFAGMVLAPRKERVTAAAAAGITAVIASYLTWSTRMQSIRRWDQAKTGFIEDAAVLSTAIAAVRAPIPKKIAA